MNLVSIVVALVLSALIALALRSVFRCRKGCDSTVKDRSACDGCSLKSFCGDRSRNGRS